MPEPSIHTAVGRRFHGLKLHQNVTAATHLQVLVGVPVGVVDDDGVSSCEVDSKAARARGQQEAEDARALVEALDGGLAVLPLDAAIQAC